MKKLTFIAGGSKGLGAQLVNTFMAQNHQTIEFSRSGSGDGHVQCDFSHTESTRKTTLNTFNSLNHKA